jgi:hypothetical protein
MSLADTLRSLRPHFVEWVKRHTTADALKDGAKTAAWVFPLTILTWVYAEQQQRVSVDSQTVSINVRTSDPSRIVNLLDAHADEPVISMEGPKAGIDSVKDLLSRPERLINIDVDPKLSTGQEHDVGLSDTIENSPIFTQRGIKVTKVMPDRVRVKLDELESRDLEVVAAPNANLDGAPTFDPKTIKVRAPHSVWVQTAGTSDPNALKAIAEFPTTGDRSRPGQHSNEQLTVRLPVQGENVTPSVSPTVQATYQIKQSSVRLEIKTLILHTAFVGTTANDLVVDLSKSNVDIWISGPPEKCRKVVDAADQNQTVPYAMVTLDADDVLDVRNGTKDSKTMTKTLTYDLGDPDVVVDAPDLTKTIDVTIRKRPS